MRAMGPPEFCAAPGLLTVFMYAERGKSIKTRPGSNGRYCKNVAYIREGVDCGL